MKKLLVALCCLAAGLFPVACVKVDQSLGQGLIDKSLLFDTYTVEFPLEKVEMRASEGLSGYSDSRIAIGAIRDEVFGLTTREAAFSLIPALDTIDLGTNPRAVSLSISFAADTVSCADDSQAHIFQNLYITELTQVLPDADEDTKNTREIPHGTELITEGLPIYSGTGALNVTFTQAFAQKYVDALVDIGPVLVSRAEDLLEEDVTHYDEWVARVPGIHIRTDAPEGIGGRINLFHFSSLSVTSNHYVRNSNGATLKVNSTWNGVQKDSSFFLIPGEPEFSDEAEYLDMNTKFYQYCFNRTSQSTQPGLASGNILVEGGGGLKPVITARELQEKTLEAIAAHGGSAEDGIIIKATIVLPYENPAQLEDMKYFPSILSPTICATETDGETGNVSITFAGLTDASVSTEDQGNLDRANRCYSPDITYHLQEILTRTDLDTNTDADVWLLTVHSEKVANASASPYDDAYYQQLMYANYYNSLYGGGMGYGYGYGSGYGGGYGYSNYYNYMMLAQMMAASQQQTYSVTTELDKDRYYCAKLNGPMSPGGRTPFFRVTFAVPSRH